MMWTVGMMDFLGQQGWRLHWISEYVFYHYPFTHHKHREQQHPQQLQGRGLWRKGRSQRREATGSSKKEVSRGISYAESLTFQGDYGLPTV